MKTISTLTLSPVTPIIALVTMVCCAVATQALAQTNCATPPSGLVGWWRGEGDALDSAGTNNGTLTGNTAYGLGRVGQGFVFDGENDAVLLENLTSLQLQDFTIETWIKRSSALLVSFAGNGIGQLFAYGQGGYGLYLDPSGTPALTKVGIGQVKPAVSIADTDLHHLAVTKSGSTVVFYLDGTAYSASSYNPGFTFTTPVAIGARADNLDNSFYGLIDEMSVYNRALATNEIQAIYSAGISGKCQIPPTIESQPQNSTAVVGENATFDVTATGTLPLSYQWRFNETNIAGATGTSLTLTDVQLTNAGTYSVVVTNDAGSATSSNVVLTVNSAMPCAIPLAGLISWWRGESNALDSVGNNNGTLANQATYAGGKVGEGYVFDGNGDGVQVGSPPSLQLQDFTIEAWVKRASPSVVSFGSFGNGIIFGYGSGGYGLYLDPSGTPALSKIGSSAVVPGTTITDTNFHHLAVAKSGSTVTFYIDGTAYPASAYNPGFTFSTSAAIGARGDNLDNSFLGMIDEMSVYNRALTTNEIQGIYNASASGKCVVAVAPVIISHPQNTNTIVGNNVTFTVVAGGSVPFNYQWRSNGTNIAGATNSTLILTNVQMNQAGSYAVLVANPADSVLSSNATLSVAFPTAVIRVGATNVMAGRPVTLPVTLVANGNENGVGFSLNFNPQRLVFASATLGSGAAGATLFVNTSLIATGRLGIVVAFPPQFTFAPGTQEGVRVNFNTLPLLGGASVNVTNSFADQPVLRELYDSQLQTLPANYSNGIVTLSPTVFEADVFPRPNGNQAVTGTDWAQAGRFAARLDTAAEGTEFQRADSAPRGMLGDGQMKVTDWVQTGRYLAGFDSLAAVGGPTSETVIGTGSSPVSRQLRLVNTNVLQEQSARVSVILEAQGDENALGFTLNFNPTAFSFADVTLGSGAAGASLIPNTSQAGVGRLGVVLALPAGSSFGVGSMEVVQVNLVTSPDVAGLFPISLTDQLVTRCVSDVSANELPVNYVNGTVTVSPINPNPTLVIAQSGTNVVLSWPLWAADFILQVSEGTNGLQGSWTNTPTTLQTNGSTVFVILPIATESQFFRLSNP